MATVPEPDCYRVSEPVPGRVLLALWTTTFHGAPGNPIYRSWASAVTSIRPMMVTYKAANENDSFR